MSRRIPLHSNHGRPVLGRILAPLRRPPRRAYARGVLPDNFYHCVAGLAEAGRHRGRWSLQRLPVADTAAWIDARATVDLLWLESPSNPLLVVAGLDRICAAPRMPGAILAVDNLGADVSLHSATKFIGGPSDLLCGLATTPPPAARSAR